MVPGQNNHNARRKFQSIVDTELSAPEDFRGEILWAEKIKEGFTEARNLFERCWLSKEPALLVLPHSSLQLQCVICIALVLADWNTVLGLKFILMKIQVPQAFVHMSHL